MLRVKRMSVNVPTDIYLKFKACAAGKLEFKKGYTGKALSQAMVLYMVNELMMQEHPELLLILKKKYPNIEGTIGFMHPMIRESVMDYIKKYQYLLEEDKS